MEKITLTRRNGSGVLALQLGGVGDLVLTSELIGGLKTGYPAETVTLVCRREFAPVAGLFPIPPDRVIGLDINPHVIDRPSEELHGALKNLANQFQGLRASVLIEGSLRPTWLTRFLAALLAPELSLCCGLAEEPDTVLRTALQWFGIERRELLELDLPAETGERGRYALLLDHLSAPRLSQFPWGLPAPLDTEAREWLNANGLTAGSYVVCFPGGNPQVMVKRWPQGNFGRALDSIRRQGHAVLLLGSPDEEREIADIRCALEGEPAPVFCGNLPLAFGIISKAKAYLGNDTGPMHVAQAFGVPGVAIFSGGFWPRHAPWAPGSVAMVHPLPCFGCGWDCFVGRGLCVESIPVETVTTALLDILHGTPREATHSLETVNPELLPILTNVTARYRALQRDRAERLRLILLLDSENERLRAAARGDRRMAKHSAG